MSAYEILGLEPGTADEAVIRKAYAVALKAHRPDVDPAGFARVRAAYQWVMARRAMADDAEADEDGASGEARVPDDPGEAPADELAPPRGDPALDAFAESVRAAVEGADPRVRLLTARRLVGMPAALCDPRFSGLGVALAARVALDDPALAERIASAIYEVVPPRERAALAFHEVDRRRQVGRLLVGAPEPSRRLVRALFDGADLSDAAHAGDLAGFEKDLGTRFDGDPLLEWVLTALPGLPYAKKRLARRASHAGEKAKRQAKRLRAKKNGGRGALIYVSLMIVLAAVRTCNRSPSTPWDSPPRTLTIPKFDPAVRIGDDPDLDAALDEINAINRKYGLPTIPKPPPIPSPDPRRRSGVPPVPNPEPRKEPPPK